MPSFFSEFGLAVWKSDDYKFWIENAKLTISPRHRVCCYEIVKCHRFRFVRIRTWTRSATRLAVVDIALLLYGILDGCSLMAVCKQAVTVNATLLTRQKIDAFFLSTLGGTTTPETYNRLCHSISVATYFEAPISLARGCHVSQTIVFISLRRFNNDYLLCFFFLLQTNDMQRHTSRFAIRTMAFVVIASN